ncbi:expressed unknown protein [Seminavis robusta]|uniref:Uncharacterized protein n=1 Tax=Seminavis robusta TaxID=568900 RepID=A0A9N8DIR7_9STRA|nr:expressed unknown protein [Seminavis robusta]|eukprot:Sro166_g074150.1 n/a (252) ;mRNA; r:40777-41649
MMSMLRFVPVLLAVIAIGLSLGVIFSCSFVEVTIAVDGLLNSTGTMFEILDQAVDVSAIGLDQNRGAVSVGVGVWRASVMTRNEGFVCEVFPDAYLEGILAARICGLIAPILATITVLALLGVALSSTTRNGRCLLCCDCSVPMSLMVCAISQALTFTMSLQLRSLYDDDYYEYDRFLDWSLDSGARQSIAATAFYLSSSVAVNIVPSLIESYHHEEGDQDPDSKPEQPPEEPAPTETDHAPIQAVENAAP